MHLPIAQAGKWLQSVLCGYYQYHAVPGNLPILSRFRHQVARLWHRTLCQRGQRRPTWKKLEEAGAGLGLLVAYSSRGACISGRSFRRQTPGGVTSKVRTVCSSSCKYGSVGGGGGRQRHSYRDGRAGLPGLFRAGPLGAAEFVAHPIGARSHSRRARAKCGCACPG